MYPIKVSQEKVGQIFEKAEKLWKSDIVCIILDSQSPSFQISKLEKKWDILLQIWITAHITVLNTLYTVCRVLHTLKNYSTCGISWTSCLSKWACICRMDHLLWSSRKQHRGHQFIRAAWYRANSATRNNPMESTWSYKQNLGCHCTAEVGGEHVRIDNDSLL